MSRVLEEQSGLASGLMMTGHEIGAAFGVAAITAVAGSLATRSGIIAGYANPSTPPPRPSPDCSC